MGTFAGKKIKNTYTGIIQYSGSKFYDALGNQISASIDITASYAVFSDTATSASYVLGSDVDGLVQSAANAITSSYVSGDNVDGTVANANIAQIAISASYATTASYAGSIGTTSYSTLSDIPSGIVSSSAQIASKISGSFTSTSASIASDISNIINGTTVVATASYAFSASVEITKEVSSSYADYAATASYALNSVPAFPYTGSAIISGALNVIGPITSSGFLSSAGIGNPSFISTTILNLSASAAVAINNTVLRLASFTDSQTSSLTPQNGDILFNSTSERVQLYSGSEFTNLLIEGDVTELFNDVLINTGSLSTGDLLVYYDSNNENWINTRTLSGSYAIENGNLNVTGSVNVSEVLNLAPSNPLPSGNVGDLAVSGSNLYFFNGSWTQVI
jgi:hypothetical protein